MARDLAPLGYEIHLFDEQKKGGGMMRSQIPAFRLPETVLNEEVNYILDLGIHTHFNTYVSSLQEVLDKDYDAVFVGTGAPRGRDLPNLPGRGKAPPTCTSASTGSAAWLLSTSTRSAKR